MKNTRIQQYICPNCGHEHLISLNIQKKSHIAIIHRLCQKALEYELIEYNVI